MRRRQDHPPGEQRHRHQRPGDRRRRAGPGQDQRRPAAPAARRRAGRLRRDRRADRAAVVARPRRPRGGRDHAGRRPGRRRRHRRRRAAAEHGVRRGPARLGTRVLTVSIADPEQPEVVDDVAYDARLLSARQHGDAVRLVLSSGLPDLDFVHPGKGRNQRAALRGERGEGGGAPRSRTGCRRSPPTTRTRRSCSTAPTWRSRPTS